jgi:hypothetical protein
MALKPLIPAALYDELMKLFERLSAPFPWNLPRSKEKFAVLEAALPEVVAAREKLMCGVEWKLGR